MAKVLIVEDDEVIGPGMARHLAAAGCDPLWVTKGEQGLARLRYVRPDVCVLDLMLPQTDGWRIIEAAGDDGIGTPIRVVSASTTEVFRRKMREKIDRRAPRHTFIQTRYGVGYRLDAVPK